MLAEGKVMLKTSWSILKAVWIGYNGMNGTAFSICFKNDALTVILKEISCVYAAF